MPAQSRVAVVTGGGSGIGAATARHLARNGPVALLDRHAGRVEAVADEIRKAGGEARAFVADVSDSLAVQGAVRSVEATLGSIAVLVNSAGTAERKSFLDMSIDEWRRVLDVNLTGSFLCAQAVASSMVRRGEGGAIVNVSSVAGLTGVPERTAYSASKHGVVGLTRSLALGLAPHGIRVNAVAPGAVETRMTAGLRAEPGAQERLARSHPLGRAAQAEEVAELIAFLASDRASFITGAVMAVDGGFLAGKLP